MSFSTLLAIAVLSHSFVSQFSKYLCKQIKKDLKQIFLNTISLKHMVMEMSGRENVRSGKYLSGEMFGRGSLRRGSFRSGNCPFGEMSIREVSVGEVSVEDLSSGKCQSGKYPVGKMSVYHMNNVFKFRNIEILTREKYKLNLKIPTPNQVIYRKRRRRS